MYGTLRGALAGRKIPFDRDSYTATVEGRISGIGKTIRIKSIHVHYDLAVPPESQEATERALQLHPQGCPAHQSVKDAIVITGTRTSASATTPSRCARLLIRRLPSAGRVSCRAGACPPPASIRRRRNGGGRAPALRESSYAGHDVDARGARMGTVSARGGRKVKAMATAPRPIADEPMNIHA